LFLAAPRVVLLPQSARRQVLANPVAAEILDGNNSTPDFFRLIRYYSIYSTQIERRARHTRDCDDEDIAEPALCWDAALGRKYCLEFLVFCACARLAGDLVWRLLVGNSYHYPRAWLAAQIRCRFCGAAGTVAGVLGTRFLNYGLNVIGDIRFWCPQFVQVCIGWFLVWVFESAERAGHRRLPDVSLA